MPNEEGSEETNKYEEENCPAGSTERERQLKQSCGADGENRGSGKDKHANPKINSVLSPSRGGEAIENFGQYE